MKKVLILLLVYFLWIPFCQAGIFNEYATFKEFVNGLQVKQGMFYDAHASNWEHVIAGSLYDFCRQDIPIVSIEAGYMIQDIGLIIANFNISGLEAFGLNFPIGELGLRIGGGAGYDFRHHEPAYGVALFGFTWKM